MSPKPFLPVDARLEGKCWRRFADYDFAKNDLGSVIVSSEVSLIASFAPFVFRRFGTEVSPYVLFSLSGERNAFVSQNGAWLGGYVPAGLRSYPFSLLGRPEKARLAVRTDAIIHDQKACPENLPFLTECGGHSEHVQKVHDFLRKMEAETDKTRQMMKKIVRMGLLTSYRPLDLTRKDRNQFLMINWQRVNENTALAGALSKDIALQRVLHAHAISLLHIRRLRALEAEAPVMKDQNAKPTADVDGFLEALGSALETEA